MRICPIENYHKQTKFLRTERIYFKESANRKRVMYSEFRIALSLNDAMNCFSFELVKEIEPNELGCTPLGLH